MGTRIVEAQVEVLGAVSNDAETVIGFEEPYSVGITVVGTAPYVFHRWCADAIKVKAAAPKGSAAKTTDDIESYVYRNGEGVLCVPGEQFRMAAILASKFKRDPRSPRKCAVDLFKAGLLVEEELCPTGKKVWDYVDERRVNVQHQGVNRMRPCLWPGWSVELTMTVLLPEYISPRLLNEVVQMSGRFNGVGNHRPTNGRFQVTKFTKL